MNAFADSPPVNQRFFSPDSAIWRVDREMALLLGGGRALLMQLAHPKLAAGVADHSHFKENPLGRLYRTMDTMWSIVFDDEPKAQASVRRVNDIHARVHGIIKEGEPLPEGTAYSALDPELLLWVHATLVDSAILAYGLFVKPLNLTEKARYYGDTKKLASVFDISESDLPPSLESFNAYIEDMLNGNAIAVGSTARSLASEILYPRPWILKIPSPLFLLVTVGLLPPTLRKAYGLEWNPNREKAFQFFAKSIRCLLPLVPSPLRIVPHARAAEKRMALRRHKMRCSR
jgi:uncharacterized protein (DUF2236 family)